MLYLLISMAIDNLKLRLIFWMWNVKLFELFQFFGIEGKSFVKKPGRVTDLAFTSPSSDFEATHLSRRVAKAFSMVLNASIATRFLTTGLAYISL